MLEQFDKLLSSLPLDGYKSALGFALQFIAPVVPGVGPALKIAGDVLTIIGLIHKGIKEQRDLVIIDPRNEKE